MSTAPVVFDRDLIAARRERFAHVAARHDFLLAHAVDDLVDRLAMVRRQFARVAVVGAAHGLLGRRLRASAGIGTVVELERSPALLAQCDGPKALADEEVLPLAPASLDLVASSLALHTVNDLPGTLAQIRVSLRPDGLFLANLLGGRTLFELREAFLAAEAETTGGAAPRVAPFVDVRDAGALLQRAKLALPVADCETLTVGYASPLDLMRELRAMAMSNALDDRSRLPLRRDTLRRAVAIYQERFGRADGRVTATFDIVTLTAWAPDASQQRPLRPGSARSRLADALGVPERKT